MQPFLQGRLDTVSTLYSMRWGAFYNLPIELFQELVGYLIEDGVWKVDRVRVEYSHEHISAKFSAFPTRICKMENIKKNVVIRVYPMRHRFAESGTTVDIQHWALDFSDGELKHINDYYFLVTINGRVSTSDTSLMDTESPFFKDLEDLNQHILPILNQYFTSQMNCIA